MTLLLPAQGVLAGKKFTSLLGQFSKFSDGLGQDVDSHEEIWGQTSGPEL